MQLWTVWIAQRTISCHSPLSEGYSMRKCICLSRCFLRLSIDVEHQHWLHNVGVTEQRNRWQQTRPSALLSSAALQMKIRRPTVDWLNGSDNGKRMYAGQTPAQSKVYIYIYIYIYIYTHTHTYRFQNVFLRCPTPRLHWFLSSHWPSYRFLSFMAFFIPSIQFFFGLPRALFCFGIHFNAIFGSLPSAQSKAVHYKTLMECSDCDPSPWFVW